MSISPRSPALVKMTVTEEGDLTKEQARELTEHIWNDEDKRDFALAISGTISGRKAGLNNDREQFPQIGDLELGKIRVPTLLVHGTADTDVRPEQTDNAAGRIPDAQVIRVQNGTHLCVWADPASADVQERITTVISGA